jgi:hypothetical protein
MSSAKGGTFGMTMVVAGNDGQLRHLRGEAA